MEAKNVMIYGDSLMKGTVIDERMRYHATNAERIQKLESLFGLQIINRAKFGLTIGKGKTLLSKDKEEGINVAYTLLEFGGNDCDFRWDEVSRAPEGEHLPLTTIENFKDTITEMVETIEEMGSTPILMTLPPIDAERYLDFVSRNGNDKSSILKWLGDVNMIYRFQEMYSDAVAEIARQKNILLADCRKAFLDKRNFRELIGLDGIHLAPGGYHMIYTVFEEFIKNLRGLKQAIA